MKRKIYGVPGQLECHLIVHSGPSMAKVPFRGGSITDIVRCPARYATSKLVEQVFIENSQEFQAGKIVLMDSLEIPDEAEEKARKAKEADKSDAVAEPSSISGAEADGKAAKQDNEGNSDEADGVQTIEVGCKADAVEWLKERYPEKGYNGNNLRANAAFDSACAEAGVSFIIKNA